MRLRILPAISALAITAMIPPSAMADGALTTLHPEATYPDNLQKQFWLSAKWWDENLDKAAERWNQWLLRK